MEALKLLLGWGQFTNKLRIHRRLSYQKNRVNLLN